VNVERGSTLVHCSYHKCLTVYYGRVMRAVFNRCLWWSGGFRHYDSHLADFYEGFPSDRISSINNRILDFDRIRPFRITRFIRDPRDLLVSGYFYHRRGAEAWTRIGNPTDADWYRANGVVPEGMRGTGVSFADYLASLPPEEGLLAELEFRAAHFESMARWPDRHPDMLTLRYEDVVDRPVAAVGDLLRFQRLSTVERALGVLFARRHAWRPSRKDAHVRDPRPGQWRRYFTPRVRGVVDARYGALIRQLGYPID